MKKYLLKLGQNAKKSSSEIVETTKKNKVLRDYCSFLSKNKLQIISENNKDLKKAKDKNLKKNLIKRLLINELKISEIINSIRQIIKLKDPVNQILKKWERPNGLKIQKKTISIGVIAVIYESRPNVTSDVASLCFKSGNSVILKGGSEAYFSNKILTNLFRKALKKIMLILILFSFWIIKIEK